MAGSAALTPYSLNPEEGRALTPEDKETVEQQRAREDERKANAGIAKFKIEVLFNKGFSTIKPSAGIVSFWGNANQLHGGGDTIIHFCPGKRLGRSDCNHYIPDPSHGYGFLICPKCHEVWNGDDVDGQVAARLTTQKWAELIYNYYVRLDMMCDVVIKYHTTDIRNATTASIRDGGEALASARSPKKRLRRIYTMSAIIRDTSAGADLYKRLLAFVSA
jgi:hypothetical protein